MINESLPVMDYIVDKQRLRKFLIDGPIRSKRVKDFFAAKGVYIFAQRESDTSDIASNIVLNHAGIDQLVNLMDKKAYPSISGFLLSRLSDKRILDLLEMSKRQSHDGISLHSYNDENKQSEENEIIKGRLQYSYDRYGNLLFPETTLTLDFKYKKISENKFILTVIIFRTTDFKKAMSFFSADWIKSYLELKNFNFNKLSTRDSKHKIISSVAKQLKDIKLTIDNEKIKFKFLGSLAHGSFREENDVQTNPETRADRTLETAPKTELYTDIQQLIDHVEREGHTLNKLNIILSSKQRGMFIGLELLFKNRMEISFKGVKYTLKTPKKADKLLDSEESFEEEYEPTSLKAFNSLRTKGISDEEINEILNALWNQIVDKLSQEWNKLNSDDFIG